MTQQTFDRHVRRAIDGLPEVIREWLSNIDVVVADWPSRQQLRDSGVDDPHDLLGLYEGLPLTERTADYGMVLPDKITLFRGPIVAISAGPREMREEIRRTVVHEFAHHFGIDDDRLEELGAY